MRSAVEQLATELERPVEDIDREVRGYLEEMVASHRPFFMNRLVQLSRMMQRAGYGEHIDYDASQVERVRAVAREWPTVLLPSHKSNLDASVMKVAMRDNDLPPTYIFAGINMAFWPMGSIARRSGSVFIRRETKDLPVYRATLREYLGYLTETRQNLEWYIEGGRSRTGKLLPPKLGLLVYVVDAFRQGRVDDIALVPVSIVYDQLSDVSDFAIESSGGQKRREGLGWFIEFYRRQRRRYGKVYVRFGEPISLREHVAPTGDEQADTLQLQKLSFEVCWRINQVTPITANALVALTLLGAGGTAMTFGALRVVLADLLADVTRRALPRASSVEALEDDEGVHATLAALEANGIIDCYRDGSQPVYSVGPREYLAAAFYRNTAIHFFVNTAIIEVAVTSASRSSDNRLALFWSEAMRMRDLLKFEFFFPEKDEFVHDLDADLSARADGWEERIASGDVAPVLESLHPSFASTVLRSFIEAYSVVAHELASRDAAERIEQKPLLVACAGRGKQYLLQRRLRNAESISRPLFATGYQLAENRGLLEPAVDVVARRLAFRSELDHVLELLTVVDDAALRRYITLITQREASAVASHDRSPIDHGQ